VLVTQRRLLIVILAVDDAGIDAGPDDHAIINTVKAKIKTVHR